MNLMHRLLISLTIIALTNVRADDEMSLKDVVEVLMSIGSECDPKPEEEHAVEVVKNVEEPQYASKCFRHCLMTQFEMIPEGSQAMDSEKVADLIGAVFSDRKDELQEIADNCNEKNKDVMDKCENAHAHGMCLLAQMKERDFDIPEVKDD